MELNNKLLKELQEAGTGYEVRITEDVVAEVVEAKEGYGRRCVCSECVFMELRNVSVRCPMRWACMSPYRSDRRSVVFRELKVEN